MPQQQQQPQQQPQQPQPQQIADVFFPINGVDVSTALEKQVPDTTPVGINVRAFEPTTNRARGGSRPGISQYVPAQPAGLSPIQHMNVIVDPQATAIGLSYPPAQPQGFPALDLQINGPFIAFELGSGFPPAIPPHLLKITANNQTKAHGTTFTFTGHQFTSTGLASGDSITSVSMTSEGAPASAAPGTYPIIITGALISYAHPGQYNYYKVFYNGTMTVSSSTISFVQFAGSDNNTSVYNDSFIVPLTLSANIKAGDLLVLGFLSSVAGLDLVTDKGPPLVDGTITDDAGNSYTIAGQTSGHLNNTLYAGGAFYAFAANNVAAGTNALNISLAITNLPNNGFNQPGAFTLALAVFRGAAAEDDAEDDNGELTDSSAFTASTGTVNVSGSGEMLLFWGTPFYTYGFTSGGCCAPAPTAPPGFTAVTDYTSVPYAYLGMAYQFSVSAPTDITWSGLSCPFASVSKPTDWIAGGISFTHS